MRMALLVLLTLNPFLTTWAAESCKAVFDSSRIESLDSEYSEKHAAQYGKYSVDDKRKYNFVIHDLLKRALYPLAARIGQLGSTVTVEQVKQIVQEREDLRKINESEIIEQEKQSPYAVVEPKSEWVNRYALQFTSKNAVNTGNASFYQFHTRKGIAVHASKKILWIEPSKAIVGDFGHAHETFTTVVTPVGAYGEAFSRKLLRATAVTLELVARDPELRKASEAIYNGNKKLLGGHAARAQFGSTEAAKIELTPLSGALEGIISFHQFLSATLGDKIPGAETGEQALREIVTNGSDPQLGLTAEFTSKLTMGIIGPLNLTGQYFKQAYERTPEGKLKFSSTLKDTISELTTPVMKGGQKGRCPMSACLSFLGLKNTDQNPHATQQEDQNFQPGLQLLAETYLKVFETLEALDQQ